MSQSASGRVGGMSFRSGRYGQAVGQVSNGSWRSTSARSEAKDNLSQAVAAWKSLDTPTRSAWIAMFGSNAQAYSEFIKRTLGRYPGALIQPWYPYDAVYPLDDLTVTSGWFGHSRENYIVSWIAENDSSYLIKCDTRIFDLRRSVCNERKYVYQSTSYGFEEQMVQADIPAFGSYFIRIRWINYDTGVETLRLYDRWDKLDDRSTVHTLISQHAVEPGELLEKIYI